jgi:hypothetical protein
MAEPIEDPTALVERQTIGGDRRAGDVAAKMLQLPATVRLDRDPRVQGEAVHV